MEIEEKNVKVKMSLCPECDGVIRVAIEHLMSSESKKDFMKEVSKYNLDIKTISLKEYRNEKIVIGCSEGCSSK